MQCEGSRSASVSLCVDAGRSAAGRASARTSPSQTHRSYVRTDIPTFVAFDTPVRTETSGTDSFSGADINANACCFFSLEYFDISRHLTAPEFN